MLKKLRQQYPQWTYLSPEHLESKSKLHQPVVFFWTKHSSHKLMQYVYSRLDNSPSIYFVTATNINLLTREMESHYQPLSS